MLGSNATLSISVNMTIYIKVFWVLVTSSRYTLFFPEYDMKILLGDFKVKVRKENIFKPTIGNESLHQDTNYIGVRIVNFATSKNLVVKSKMFPHRHS